MNREDFIEIIRKSYKDADDYWGPHLPMVRGAGVRELSAAHSVSALAAGLEAAQEGLGVSLLRKFAEDPVEICPPWPPWPPWPPNPPGPWPPNPPGPPPPYDRVLLGAALVFTAEQLNNKDLASTAAKLGNEMIG